MKLEDYQQQAKRTLPDLGSYQLNIAHMIFGMNSEINELFDAKDVVNLGEELSDINWYLINYCNLTNINISEKFLLSYRPNEFYDEAADPILKLICEISKLTNFEKRELAYRKKVEDDIRLTQVLEVYKALSDCFVSYEIDPFNSMQKNIDKLKARYPEKFTEEKALNRDLELERKILEGELNDYK